MDFNRFITRLQRAGFGMMLGGGFLAAPVIAAADSAADLERTLAIVKVTTDDATGSMDTLRDSVKTADRASCRSWRPTLQGAALELARSGAGRYQVSESLPGVAQFAMLADMELPAAATMLSRTAKAMQIDMADLGRVANVAAIAANSTAQNAGNSVSLCSTLPVQRSEPTSNSKNGDSARVDRRGRWRCWFARCRSRRCDADSADEGRGTQRSYSTSTL